MAYVTTRDNYAKMLNLNIHVKLFNLNNNIFKMDHMYLLLHIILVKKTLPYHFCTHNYTRNRDTKLYQTIQWLQFFYNIYSLLAMQKNSNLIYNRRTTNKKTNLSVKDTTLPCWKCSSTMTFLPIVCLTIFWHFCKGKPQNIIPYC